MSSAECGVRGWQDLSTPGCTPACLQVGWALANAKQERVAPCDDEAAYLSKLAKAAAKKAKQARAAVVHYMVHHIVHHMVHHVVHHIVHYTVHYMAPAAAPSPPDRPASASPPPPAPSSRRAAPERRERVRVVSGR